MRVRIGLVVALLVLTAGCSFSVWGEPSKQGDSTKHANLTEKPVPKTPGDLTRANVVSFAKQFEEAYKWNRELTNQTTDLSVVVVEGDLVNSTDSGYVVQLEGESFETIRDGGNREGSDDFYTAYYFVNQSDVYRIRADSESAPDPRSGKHIRG